MTMQVHYSSHKTDWETPDWLFREWNEKFHFELDVCATADTAKCSKYFTPAENGLLQPWAPHRCWMNPPYGRVIGEWVEKAYRESQRGATVVCLLPSRTDTRWWHDFVMQGEVCFLKGRVRFVGAQSCAPFPSAVVVFSSE